MVSLHMPIVSTALWFRATAAGQLIGKKEKLLQARLEVPWQAAWVSLHCSCQHYNY